MILDYQGQPARIETDPDAIANLKRKGWTERPARPSVTDSQVVEWDGSQWVTRDQTADELRRSWSAAEFMAKLTQTEMIGIITAARNDPAVELVKVYLAVHPTVHSDNPLLLSSLDMLVSKGLLTEQRKAEILS